jgi:hypothetical protein
VKYHFFALILALWRALKSTNPTIHPSSAHLKLDVHKVWLVELLAQHGAKIRANSLIVSNKNYCNHRSPMQWNRVLGRKSYRPASFIDPILKNRVGCSILINRIPVIRYFGGTRYIFTSKFTSKIQAVKKIFKKKNMRNFSILKVDDDHSLNRIPVMAPISAPIFGGVF